MGKILRRKFLRNLRSIILGVPLFVLGCNGGGGGGHKPQPPVVALNITYNDNGTYSFDAQAGDSDGSVNSIDIIVDGQPYKRYEGNQAAETLETKETNKLEAIATDNQGLTGYDAREWKTAKLKEIYSKLDELLKSNAGTYAEFQGDENGIELMLDDNLSKTHFLITRKNEKYSAIVIGDMEADLGQVIVYANILRDYGIPTQAFVRVPFSEVEPRFNKFRDKEYDI